MKSEVNGKSFEDVCNCQCTIEGNKVKVNCSCEDKEIYPNPLKETFIYNKDKNPRYLECSERHSELNIKKSVSDTANAKPIISNQNQRRFLQ